MIGHGEDLGCQPEGSTACLTVHACLNHWLGCLPGNVWRPHLPLFSSEGNLGQRIFCSLLEMHQPWSSRIKMIQCFKIYRTLLDYVGLFCFVCFAVLNFGLVQESPLLRAYLLRDISYSTNNSHLWLTLIKQLLLLAFPVCLFPCTILYSILMDPFIPTAGVYVLCAYGFLDTWASMCLIYFSLLFLCT